MKIHFVASSADAPQTALTQLSQKYGNVPLHRADVVVCLGGDGFMLEALHKVLDSSIAIYGMNYGTVGFLMNAADEGELLLRLEQAQPSVLHPLHMTAVTKSGEVRTALAFNDVFLFRQTRQTSRIRIDIDGQTRLEELICDGIIVSTPAGSTAYNLSAHGPIVPLSANLLPLTPISPFRPRRWRGALLPSTAVVKLTLLDTEKRATAAVADFTEFRDVVEVVVREDRDRKATILFDPGHGLSERIIAEQFIA
ncbi:NAD kinase [Gluconobacter kanchanaburiensis]|uniref:NAD kinase n=1 Tax=Gluconobacter kanchanaburiensis NBRC 103587 TaxID=1307948 RepID=A0A511B7D9_9PROT|nr:NAD kinase [Gluconobacter kanchanaburiensis]MBF0862498.1 NAD kinase [Gluconobacter kanchanaburiensis]GBR68522.1 ATP-NAD kinase [Gluconobacter kanchanaburiensis NBRC 103587]GEK96375.1 NAD kinase [Gluconobacter kanchanaburiensis NBRC 103587]